MCDCKMYHNRYKHDKYHVILQYGIRIACTLDLCSLSFKMYLSQNVMKSWSTKLDVKTFI